MTMTWRVWGGALALALAAPMAFAQGVIQSITSTQQSGADVVRIEFSEPLSAVPAGFAIQQPARIAIDLPGVTNGMGKPSVEINQGNLRTVNVAQAGDRTRLVLNLKQAATYRTQLDGKALLIVVDSSGPAASAAAAPATTGAAPAAATTAAPTFAPSQNRDAQSLREIDFRRGVDGAGRVLVTLPSNQVGVDIRQQGTGLLVEFPRTTVPDNLRRRLDVTDFGTPVQTVTTTQSGDRVRMVIEPRGNWEHSAYQSDTQFVVEVRPVKVDPNKLTQGPGYQGEKLSLNFQNIEVRSLLQVIADFTNFNVVTSDTVTGSLTLRLKDVPWDQALDIILQAKGLGLRKSGNVIWIAPKDELAIKEQADLEAGKKKAELEPLRTQSFQLNYTKAEDVAKGLVGTGTSGGGGGNANTRILSPRGSVISDQRTNQLFATDIPSKLEEIQSLVARIDIPVRQVLIEARIVEATDTFGKSLGAKLGFSDLRGVRGGVPGWSLSGDNRAAIGGNYAGIGRADRPVRYGRGVLGQLAVRQPAGDRPGRLRRGELRAVDLRRLVEPLPESRDLGARGRRQGQSRLESAHRHCRPGQGLHQPGPEGAVPEVHQLGCDGDRIRRGDPEAGSHAPDHARGQHHHGREDQQGQPGRADGAGPRNQRQGSQDASADREWRHRRHRRHLRPDSQ